MIPVTPEELDVLRSAKVVVDHIKLGATHLEPREYRFIDGAFWALVDLLNEVGVAPSPAPPHAPASSEETRFFPPAELRPINRDALLEPYHDIRAQAAEDLAASMGPTCPNYTRINDAVNQTLAVARTNEGHLTGSNAVLLCRPTTTR